MKVEMGEKINLNEFDILGVINLNDVQGIEKYVTPVVEDGKVVSYLSRSKEYYNVKSMTELAIEREALAQMLTHEYSKRNFVIVENMLNCSARVYFKKFEQYISSGKSQYAALQLSQAEECLMEDVQNILAILQNQGTIQRDPNKRLPGGYENSEKRAIEMDNKAILYIFAKSLRMKKNPGEIEVLTPGYGSIYMGPFMKVMYGYNFTNTLKSKYIDESRNPHQTPIRDLMSSDRAFEVGKTVLLLDDNIGTGKTMEELKQSLQEAGIRNTILGAAQYNWRNYYRVSVGEKTGIERPDITKFDILTPINYAGHKLYKHAIDLLHSSGSEYVRYLQSKAYRREKLSDIKGTLIRAATCLQRLGLQLADEMEEYVLPEEVTGERKEVLPEFAKTTPKCISNPISQEIIKRIVQEVKSLEQEEPDNAGIPR